MSANTQFFGQQSPQAVLKHGILGRYAQYFAGPAATATDGRVAFIDGYAGEGRYEDGTEGSPLLIASKQKPLEAIGRTAKLIFIELNDERRAKLETSLANANVTLDRIIGGDIEAVIDDILAEYSDHAILLFVDPFGLAFKRSTLERILNLSKQGRPIDVLFHFSLSVKRLATAALSTSPGAPKLAMRVDAALGDVDWRSKFHPGANTGAATQAALEIATAFGQAITQSTKVSNISIPIRARPGQDPLYLMMMFSRYPGALWTFADIASTAHADWLHYCDEEDYRANMAKIEQTGAAELFPELPPDRSEAESKTRERAVEYLTSHIMSLLSTHREIRPIDDIATFYGDMLGIARTKHAREAIKALHARGAISDNGVKEFWLRSLRATTS